MTTKEHYHGDLIRCIFLVLAAFPVMGQKANPADKQDSPLHFSEKYTASSYFSERFERSTMQFACKAKTKKEVEAWQRSFLPRLKGVLGLDVIERSRPSYMPKAERRDSEDAGFCTRERWIIWTEPDVPLPIVILIPKNISGKRPLVITPHGHGKNTEQYAGIYPNALDKADAEKNERNVAVQAVMEGYIAIAPTTRAFGETRIESDKEQDVSFSCHTQLLRDLLIGRTPIGDRVWDMSKIIDWAIRNLPVDAERIAITGNSGGGTVSLFAAACDKRISIAVPSSYFCTFTGSIGSIAHCDCNYIPRILELGEMSDIAGLIAPRPLCVINGKEDKIFPIEETRKAFVHLKEIYAAAAVEDNVMLYEGAGGHRYYKEGSWPFIKKYFDALR